VDHIGSAALLQQKYQCAVYISETDMPYVQGIKKREGIKKIISSLARVAPPERLQTLPAGNILNIRIIPTPGHTPGHTCFLFEDVLFAGDLLNSRNGVLKKSPPLMTWDKQQAIDSVKAMNSVKFVWVCPAHGKPVKTSRIEI
jgi:glyoxylase-like metal-dependent hydrolase (beta-lactamase superfamily II)